MLSRILIANRGEIAVRIIRACKEMGVQTVAVYSEADKESAHVGMADEAICIGPPPAGESYLNTANIIAAAEVADVDAIHPGYGFLAENSQFAEICASCNIDFIGPSPESMILLGDKERARALAQSAGVSILPGNDEPLTDDADALSLAHKIGFPVIIKAAAGGGGRGMRVARNDPSLINSINIARAEAQAAFKDSSIYIEKYLEDARHIEFQLLADKQGNIVHLGERDCTLQRRHQKLVEESPSPAIGPRLREEMGEAAVAIAKASNYSNAGTAEFLLDQEGKFYFIEMNCRVQVEHPVTEMVTGIDIVLEQFRVANGNPLAFTQDDIHLNGVAIECRINAEDPNNNFKPDPNRITKWYQPGGRGVRIDTHSYSGMVVSPYYDSLVAKLIVHRPTRAECITAMKCALDEFDISGIKTTIPLYQEIFGHTRFIRGLVNTTFIEDHFTR
ncbi:MAG: acetyl-CoA carboxylase biotin carboxylase subunit [Planctomycetota bacterium]|jgi:acetyl-CoA carboxylase biotin carboxylase subunit|nr:acetyl-CoA carboxylase biotin carboxylase subunit [Planctomycetota bacterium]